VLRDGCRRWSQNVNLKLEWLPGRFAVCTLAKGAPVPAWASRPSDLVSITRTDEELSIIALEAHVDAALVAERGFVAMRLVGPIEFSAVGVLASLTAALRDADVPVLAVSTYRTDILLVRQSQAQQAWAALQDVAEFAPPPPPEL
jgi:hypothetical protein